MTASRMVGLMRVGCHLKWYVELMLCHWWEFYYTFRNISRWGWNVYELLRSKVLVRIIWPFVWQGWGVQWHVGRFKCYVGRKQVFDGIFVWVCRFGKSIFACTKENFIPKMAKLDRHVEGWKDYVMTWCTLRSWCKGLEIWKGMGNLHYLKV